MPRGEDDPISGSSMPTAPAISVKEIDTLRNRGLQTILDDLGKFSEQMRPLVQQNVEAAQRVSGAHLAHEMNAAAASGILAWGGYPATKQEMVAAAMALLIGNDPPQVEAPQELPLYGTGSQEFNDAAPQVVCVTGYTQSGKDVIGDIIQETGARVARTTFSAAIMPEANALLAYLGRGEVIHGENKNHFPYRFLLQTVGDGRRVEDPDYWSKQMGLQIARLLDEGAQQVVVTGARAVKEVQYVRDLPQHFPQLRDATINVFRVKRPGSPYKAIAEIELALDVLDDSEFDAVILNDVEGDLAHFTGNIQERIKEWL